MRDAINVFTPQIDQQVFTPKQILVKPTYRRTKLVSRGYYDAVIPPRMLTQRDATQAEPRNISKQDVIVQSVHTGKLHAPSESAERKHAKGRQTARSWQLKARKYGCRWGKMISDVIGATLHCPLCNYFLLTTLLGSDSTITLFTMLPGIVVDLLPLFSKAARMSQRLAELSLGV